jgi:hypothetical protein
VTAHATLRQLSPMRTRPARAQTIAVASGVLAAVIQLVAGWPGWMTSASVGLYQQATAGPYTDWYSPMLAWFWSHAQPVEHGSLVPFLVQLELFWAGVTMIAVGLQPAARWTRFLPLLVLVNPATWVVMFLWRDTFVLCLLTAAAGVASLAMRPVRRGDLGGTRVPLWCAAIIAGLSGLAWPRSLPLAVLLVAALCLAILPRAAGPRRRMQIASKAMVLILVAGLMAAFSVPAIVLGDVVHTRADESIYALDAYRIDCSAYWATGQPGARTDPVSPAALWKGGSPPCQKGTPASYGSAWTGSGDPTGAQVLGFSDWLGMLAGHPGVVVGGRIQQLAAMLAGSFAGVPDVNGGQVVSAPAAAGTGEVVHSPSRGGVVLAIYAGLSTFVPGMLILWILVAPVGAGWWLSRRRRADSAAAWGTLWPLLAWPTLYAAAAGLAAAGTDPSVIAPAAALGWVLALWALGLDGAGPLPPRLARVVELAQASRYLQTAPSAPRRLRVPRLGSPKHAVPPEPVEEGSLSAFAAQHALDVQPADGQERAMAGADSP